MKGTYMHLYLNVENCNAFIDINYKMLAYMYIDNMNGYCKFVELKINLQIFGTYILHVECQRYNIVFLGEIFSSFHPI